MPKCKLPECPIASGGRCLEGRTDDCPNLLPESSDAVPAPVPAVKEKSGKKDEETLALFSGLPLEIADAREFAARGRAIVVALTGMTESGKTSLLARLHQQFQAGTVGGYAFAGSRTLPRFEELNWLATIESGVGAPRMEHTSRKYDNSFLHFTVLQSHEGALPIDVLLNDISGETYPEAITAESICRQLICLSRADHLAVVVDGAAIANRSLRHDHCSKAKNFVERVLQTGQINKATILHLIITKLDVLSDPAKAEENTAAAARLEEDFTKNFRTKVAGVHTWRIAARPRDGTMPTEESIAKLFATWVGSTRRYDSNPTVLPLSSSRGRDFNEFGT
ncbi:MAG TPA: hypothetical protein VGN17_10715 [Bryobacteraceae bacterium]|jgi:hypothetical protein